MKKERKSVFPDVFVMGTSDRKWTTVPDRPTFELYQKDDRWFWRLVATNGRVLAFGNPGGYPSKAACQELKPRVAVAMRESKEVEVDDWEDQTV